MTTRVILRDGRVADFRVARNTAKDRQLIQQLFHKVSDESLYYRFFHVVREVSDSFIDTILSDDASDNMTLLCTAGDSVLGMGTYTRVNEERAEVAFLVDDKIQGKGIGTLLLEHLAERAWESGYQEFEANVLGDNYRMLSVFKSSGYELERHQDSDMVKLVLPLTRTERSRALYAAREKLATSASLAPFMNPESVAVVGASRDQSRLGHVLFRNIVQGGFRGTVYPVNPSAHSVAAVRAYASVSDIPERIDLAVIVVPSELVLSVVDDCIKAGVRAVMITSAGFSERDEKGVELEHEIVLRLRNAGVRLIGPNCLGLVNAREDMSLNASFALHVPMSGNMAIASQSGALGVAILEYASRIGIGISSFVSIGNKPDVSSNDLVQYWEDDPNTKVIALYLESFGNPRKFSRLARRITRTKPIVVVKSARTHAGAAVSQKRSHVRDLVVRALFRQAGIIRVDTLQDLFDTSALLTFAPLPKGRRVAVLTNTAGGAVITVDAILTERLHFVEPVIDLGSDALAEGYRITLPAMLRDETVDAVIVIFVPVGLSDQKEVSRAVSEAIQEVAAEGISKPVIANFLTSGEYFVHFVDAGSQRVPIYPFPEQAVSALAKVTQYAMYRHRPQGRIVDLENFDSEAARTMVRTTRDTVQGELLQSVIETLFQSIGIPLYNIEDMKLESYLYRVAILIEPDPLFGPLIRLRLLQRPVLDNRWLDLRDDMLATQVVRITPLTDLDSREMVEAVVGQSLPMHSESYSKSLEDLLLRLSRVVEEVHEVESIHISEVVLRHGTCQIPRDAVRVMVKQMDT